VRIHTKPTYVFRELLTYLENRRIVIPGYSVLQNIVGKALSHERERLELVISAHLTEYEKDILDNLLTDGDTLHELTLLKKEPKDFGYKETRLEIARLADLKNLYRSSQAILLNLGISKENIKYYASLVGYYTIQKLKRMSPVTAYVYLLCFLSNRYQKGHDNLVNTFLHHVNQYVADVKNAAKEMVYEYAIAGNTHMKDVSKILNLFVDDNISEEMTFSKVKEIAFGILDRDKIPFMSKFISGVTFDETEFQWDYITRIDKQFKKNLRPLLQNIEFYSHRKDDPLLASVDFLKHAFKKQKSLGQFDTEKIPQGVISTKLKKYMFNFNKTEENNNLKKIQVINPHRYEFLVYRLLAKGLESGDIFVRESLNFKSFEEDLIGQDEWKNKDELIQKLDLPFLKKSVHQILDDYKKTVEGLLYDVNRRIKDGENKEIKMTQKGDTISWKLPYNKREEPINNPIYEGFRPIELSELLYFVNQKCGFMSSFTHVLGRYVKGTADDERLLACLVALGTNHGLSKMAEMSDMKFHELNTTANNFIRLETLKSANDQITNSMANLPIFKHYNIREDTIHSSSDGQKYETQFHTINSRYSPKYFGLKKGVAAYSLVANHIPANAKIIGTHEHESYHVLDILYNNTSEVDPKVHSVDMHGINHVNFFILDAFGYVFAPRYTKVNEMVKMIFGFMGSENYENYLLKPVRKTKEDLIIDEWDNVLRILVSLATRTTTQSTIIRKLSSYTRVNRTKKALWELDNIVKTIYILNYLDSLELRRNVQKALNRGEAYHKLRRAVFYAHLGKFRVKTELEQHIWSECSRLISNAIIFYNAFILSELMTRFENTDQFEEADLIKRVSPVGWRHVNLYGVHRFHRPRSDTYVEETLRLLESDRTWIANVKELES
jgi:TnpA family transposase